MSLRSRPLRWAGLLPWLLLTSTPVHALPEFGFESDLPGQPPAGFTATAVDRAEVLAQDSTVTPAVMPQMGQRMLALGTPKAPPRQQPIGLNGISTSFAAAGGDVRFALRLLSSEQRKRDRVRIDLSDSSGTPYPVSNGAGAPFALTMPDGTVLSCSGTPCDMIIDVGQRPAAPRQRQTLASASPRARSIAG